MDTNKMIRVAKKLDVVANVGGKIAAAAGVDIPAITVAGGLDGVGQGVTMYVLRVLGIGRHFCGGCRLGRCGRRGAVHTQQTANLGKCNTGQNQYSC